MILITKSGRCPVLWRSRKSALTIPAELHEKLSRLCHPIDQVPSEVLRVRMISEHSPKTAKIHSDPHRDYSTGA